MNIPTERPGRTAGTSEIPVQSRDRFARTDGRPQRNTPLMRKIEVAFLLPDLSISRRSVSVPRSPTFEHAAAGFARGAVLPTINGPVAIEDIEPGDYVDTSRGPQAVLWVGSTLLQPGPAGAGSSLTHLTRVMADAFGPSRPERDLILGPGARIVRKRTLDDDHCVLCPVSDIVDGLQAFDVTPPSAVELFHLRFARHATFRVNGLEVESYHPGEDIHHRLQGRLRDAFLGLFPGIDSFAAFGPLSVPRIASDRMDSRDVA